MTIMRLYPIRFAAVFFLFFSCFFLFARDVRITVIDSDLNLPLEGATVRTRDGIEYTCDANGNVTIQAPEDRQIIVQAAYPGYEAGIISIPVTGNHFTIQLRLSGVMQARELVIEAERPGQNETRTGRSIAVSSRDISQTAEIGIIEDVMSTISLLPGVSYSGFLDAQPSIRGGHPGDMSASLNGFYINNPFFWGGTFSIFDPRMVQHAQLSHGVFSSRYGHTISGLLEITTKNPSPTQTQFELSMNTSAANFNISVPFAGKGGILVMGRITYYDPVLALAGELSPLIPELELVSSFEPVPYIRTATLNGNYRFTDKLELNATGFFGMDGVGVKFNNVSTVNEFLSSNTSIDFLFTNYQAFFTSSLSWNPSANTLLKFMAGTGYEEQVNYGNINYDINRSFSDTFKTTYPAYFSLFQNIQGADYNFKDSGLIDQSESNLNVQGRLDFDWEISKHVLLSAGAQTMYNHFNASGIQSMTIERAFNGSNGITDPAMREQIEAQITGYFSPYPVPPALYDFLIVAFPVGYPPNPSNNLLSTSGFILGEFSIGNRFNAELGIRIDHFMLFGKNDFTVQSDPVFNPRLNLEFNLYSGSGFFRKIDLALGTGIFSSINSNVFSAEEQYNITKFNPNRSWTSIFGIKFEFPQSITLNVEGYYKHIYDRMYIVMNTATDDYNTSYDISPHFDGEGTVWGIDVMIQKLQSRYFDGWLSYSFSYAKYRDPQGGNQGIGGGNRGNDWYFPTFHRFHTLNLVMNYKPVQSINIYTRFGLASGVPLRRRSEEGPVSLPVYLYENEIFIEKFYWRSSYDDSNRTTPSLNLDIKFSYFGTNRKGRSRYEFYFAVENVLGLLYSAQGNTSFNQYTGEMDTGSFAATFDMPIPIPSFGFRISY
ncbi:MAG: TonB-dependent receptor [Treponema sp.]|nr:TonB-dependent receptor [Treponema sp.]MCL2236716.1 TonB-dependent receptor [Treponema sp.]